MNIGVVAPALRQAAKLMESRHLEQAQAQLLRHLQKHPADPGANELLQEIGHLRRDMTQALYYARRSVAADPGNIDLLANLGLCLTAARLQEEAVGLLAPAVADRPGETRLLTPLVMSLIELGRFHEALGHLMRARPVAPDDPMVLSQLGVVLSRLGRVHDAVAAQQRLMEVDPGHIEGAQALAATLNYADGVDPALVLGAHKNFARLLAEQTGPPLTRWDVTREPDRRLRVGLISPDLRAHSVGYFVEPLLEHHDRAGIELVCYSTAVTEDAVSTRFRGLVSAWSNVGAYKISDIARNIVGDRIDVLLDLAGYTVGNKLPLLLVKPAPIQATWIGYPNTTGLATVDYRIVDGLTDPPGFESLATERLLRLDPCFLCYRPPAEAPATAPPGAGGSGVTFGSFGSHVKLTERTVDLWSRVVLAVPGSRLFYKSSGVHTPATKEELLGRFAAKGLGPDRVVLEGPTKGTAEHLAAYDRMDVALDTYPYHGTTTTCESLWMGVPTVSLIGNSHASRVGLSLLTNVGHPEWAAHSDDEFVRTALALAEDRELLARLRSPGPEGLRAQMAASPLCDGPALCRRFEAAIREAWREWCAKAGTGARK